MNTDRVEVFHRADGDNVALCVTDNLELDFLPARNTLFNKYLCDRRKTQTVCCNLVQFILAICNTAACTAERERRTYNYGIVYNLGKIQSVLNGFNYL